ncbi:uncharacterized protein B0I36DRAFT_433876 [Microdochium trichocladiopsis]|uniref:Uncharacterized protein n=1 Tax=Microdochium trichocladiopsis TaxID=1682393 RepID=A0A9P8Y3C7_9PEZI|nr:uncharacterized protein B0I36DRAFT_433876 [Microdochium trichocladiopsis]KAH7026437.1 hypothetical protein B0I36DRAFT_433876 [Microdochium trichocladiopsis]
MMKQPRTRATIADKFGDARMAATLLSVIRSPDQDLFVATDYPPSASELVAKHSVEAYLDGQKLVADLERAAKGHKYDFSTTREAIEVSRQAAAFQIQVLRLGKNIDWMIEATPDCKLAPVSRPVLGRAMIVKTHDSVGEFPRFRKCPLVENLTVISAYEFQWANDKTPYLVELTVLRWWATSASCEQGDVPVTSLGIAMRDDERGLEVDKETVAQLIEHIGLLAKIIDEMVE